MAVEKGTKATVVTELKMLVRKGTFRCEFDLDSGIDTVPRARDNCPVGRAVVEDEGQFLVAESAGGINDTLAEASALPI